MVKDVKGKTRISGFGMENRAALSGIRFVLEGKNLAVSYNPLPMKFNFLKGTVV